MKTKHEMPESVVRKCENCKFWDLCTGECRKALPRLVRSSIHDEYYAKWPVVEENKWCGEFELRRYK